MSEEKDTSVSPETESTPAAEQPASEAQTDAVTASESPSDPPASPTQPDTQTPTPTASTEPTESANPQPAPTAEPATASAELGKSVEPGAAVSQPAEATAPAEAPAADAADKPKPAPKAAPAAKTATAAGDAPAKPAPPKKAPPPPDPRVEAAKAKAEELKKAIDTGVSAEAVVETGAAHVHPMLLIRKEDWVAVVDFLKRSDYKLNYLECMAGTDYPNYIEVVIYLQSTELGHFVCLKTRTDRENAELPSLTAVHPGVNWEEREIYDLLGITFTGHPDLRRIMLEDDFKGHPLRKDFNVWEA